MYPFLILVAVVGQFPFCFGCDFFLLSHYYKKEMEESMKGVK